MDREPPRIEHKPHLNYPWQVRIKNHRGKWVMLEARKTEAECIRIVERLKEGIA
jgi:hypothetical protein